MTRLDQLLEFHRASPTDTFVLFAVAKEYEKMGDNENALQWFGKLLDTDANYTGAYYHLGKIFERLEQPAQAFATYQKGMSVAQAQHDQHAFNELAAAKLNLGDEEDF